MQNMEFIRKDSFFSTNKHTERQLKSTSSEYRQSFKPVFMVCTAFRSNGSMWAVTLCKAYVFMVTLTATLKTYKLIQILARLEINVSLSEDNRSSALHKTNKHNVKMTAYWLKVRPPLGFTFTCMHLFLFKATSRNTSVKVFFFFFLEIKAMALASLLPC